MTGDSHPRLPWLRCKEIWRRYYLRGVLLTSGSNGDFWCYLSLPSETSALGPSVQTDPTPAAQEPPDFHSVFHGLDVFLVLSFHSFFLHKENSLVDGKKASLQLFSENRMIVPHDPPESPFLTEILS